MNESLLNKAGIEIAAGMGSLQNETIIKKEGHQHKEEKPHKCFADREQSPQMRAFKLRSNIHHDGISNDQKLDNLLQDPKKSSADGVNELRKKQREISRTETNNWRKKSLMKVTDMA